MFYWFVFKGHLHYEASLFGDIPEFGGFRWISGELSPLGSRLAYGAGLEAVDGINRWHNSRYLADAIHRKGNEPRYSLGNDQLDCL